jgi:hypothetical protein
MEEILSVVGRHAVKIGEVTDVSMQAAASIFSV